MSHLYTAMLDVQTAVYAKLTGDSTLMAKISGVFDEIPEQEAFPYIEIGTAEEEPENNFLRTGRAVVITVGIWSDYDGYKEAHQILDDCHRLLDMTESGPTLTVSGWEVFAHEVERSDTVASDDRRLRGIEARYRVLVSHIDS